MKNPNIEFGTLPLALAFLALCSIQNAFAVTPAPDGGYPGNNTAEGTDALFSLPANGGTDNVGIGFDALHQNTSGHFNTATGSRALQANTSGSDNTAVGCEALFTNTTGYDNTATGFGALGFTTSGSANTATGSYALTYNTTGSSNTAQGYTALLLNTGDSNSAVGRDALGYNTTGYNNTAIGVQALWGNLPGSTGFNNTATGFQALQHISTGFNNTAIGYRAGFLQTTGSNNVYIGANVNGFAGESNTCYIRGIYATSSSGGLPVYVNFNNKLGTVTSSKRFKDDIQPMGRSSEALLALKPVTFRYKTEIDPAHASQFGLVAEEVEKVNPDLVVRDKDGKAYGVRYDQVNAMLLNEFLKQHKTVEAQNRKLENQKKAIHEQEAISAELKSIVAKQEKRLEALVANMREQDSRIHGVSTKVEISSHPLKLAVNGF